MGLRGGRSAFIPATVVLLAILCGGAAPVDDLPARRIAFVQVPVGAVGAVSGDLANSILAGRYPAGMRIVTATLNDVRGSRKDVASGFASACDPAFSYDGQRLAFSGRRNPDDPMQIWEMEGTSGPASPLVVVSADCITPVYTPTGGILFASTLAGEYEEHGGRYAFSIFTQLSGDFEPTRLTFNPSSDFDPAFLPDGRIVYSSWQHVGNHHWPGGTVALMLVNSDGTGVFPLTGNHRGPWMKRGVKSWRGDRGVFIQSDGSRAFGAGELVSISLNDPFGPRETLVPIDQYEVSSVAPLPAGGLIVSARPVGGARNSFGLYRYDNGGLTLLFDDPNSHELSPAVGGQRARPDVRFSTVVPDKSYGYLAVLNCYETDRTDQHPLRAGSIHTVRVIEGMPLRRRGNVGPTFLEVDGRAGEPLVGPAGATGYIPSRILGEVSPAEDGSIYLKVPADRPLRIQLVDQRGFTLVNERAWFWVRPHERRVCIGCHENRELAPPNKAPMAVLRAPTDLTDPSGFETVSFRSHIQPIINTSCALADCHVPPTPTAGMNLTADRLNGEKDAVLSDRFGPAYANLMARQENKPASVGGRRVHAGDARSSPMLWMLYGRALTRQFKPAPFERPMLAAHPGPMLPEAQLRLIRKWIDLGAVYNGDSPPGPWPYKIPPADVVVLEGESDAK